MINKTLLAEQLELLDEDSENTKDKNRPSQPLRYILRFENEHVDAFDLGKISNVVFYAKDVQIQRINIDSMRQKNFQEKILKNLSMEETEDLRVITDYDPDKDDVRLSIDVNLGF
jgi:hypothetical protein